MSSWEHHRPLTRVFVAQPTPVVRSGGLAQNEMDHAPFLCWRSARWVEQYGPIIAATAPDFISEILSMSTAQSFRPWYVVIWHLLSGSPSWRYRQYTMIGGRTPSGRCWGQVVALQPRRSSGPISKGFSFHSPPNDLHLSHPFSWQNSNFLMFFLQLLGESLVTIRAKPVAQIDLFLEDKLRNQRGHLLPCVVYRVRVNVTLAPVLLMPTANSKYHFASSPLKACIGFQNRSFLVHSC